MNKFELEIFYFIYVEFCNLSKRSPENAKFFNIFQGRMMDCISEDSIPEPSQILICDSSESNLELITINDDEEQEEVHPVVMPEIPPVLTRKVPQFLTLEVSSVLMPEISVILTPEASSSSPALSDRTEGSSSNEVLSAIEIETNSASSSSSEERSNEVQKDFVRSGGNVFDRFSVSPDENLSSSRSEPSELDFQYETVVPAAPRPVPMFHPLVIGPLLFSEVAPDLISSSIFSEMAPFPWQAVGIRGPFQPSLSAIGLEQFPRPPVPPHFAAINLEQIRRPPRPPTRHRQIIYFRSPEPEEKAISLPLHSGPGRAFSGRFRCAIEGCAEICANAQSAQSHVMAHYRRLVASMEKTNPINQKLQLLTECLHCERMFLRPYDMQAHLQTAHGTPRLPFGFFCEICELVFPSQENFNKHYVKVQHFTGEAPYVCPSGDFRSSLRSDVLVHFEQNHGESSFLLCPLCLQAVPTLTTLRSLESARDDRDFNEILEELKYLHNGKVCKPYLPAHMGAFCAHVLEHAYKEIPCRRGCRLKFLSDKQRLAHVKSAHFPAQGLIQIPTGGGAVQAPISLAESFKLRDRRPISNRNLDVHSADICLTCRKPVGNLMVHFSSDLLTCGPCGFQTHCHDTRKEHNCRGGADRPAPAWKPRPPVLDQCYECSGCGYSSISGNKLATHLALCWRSNGMAMPSNAEWSLKRKRDAEKMGDKRASASAVPESVLASLGLVKKSEGEVQSKKRKTILQYCEKISPRKLNCNKGDLFEAALFRKRRRTIRFGEHLCQEETANVESNERTNFKRSAQPVRGIGIDYISPG